LTFLKNLFGHAVQIAVKLPKRRAARTGWRRAKSRYFSANRSGVYD
jgi:hypothetical protein